MKTEVFLEPLRHFDAVTVLAVCRTTAVQVPLGTGAAGWLEKVPIAVLILHAGSVQALSVDGAPFDLEALCREVPQARAQVDALAAGALVKPTLSQ